MDRSQDLEHPGRRRFLAMMGLACASTTLASAAAFAQAPAAPPAAKPAEKEAPKGPSAEAQSLAAAVQARYPGRLDPQQVQDLMSDVDDRIDSSRALRALKLANGDEPDFAFEA